MLSPGSKFPTFSLQDQDAQVRTNADFGGRLTVFYFYPKDDTSGCTVEACAFQEAIPNFGVHSVVGISPDSVKSHKKFAEKYHLGFPLLVDEDHKLAEACGVWVEKSMYGKKYMGIERTTFLVDGSGTVLHVWNKVKPQGHSDEVLSVIQQL